MFCSIQSLAKAEADEVADNGAHTREAGRVLVETIIPAPGAEHQVEAGQGALLVSAQHVLLSIRGGVPVLSVEYLVAAVACHGLDVLCALVPGAGSRRSAPVLCAYTNI